MHNLPHLRSRASQRFCLLGLDLLKVHSKIATKGFRCLSQTTSEKLKTILAPVFNKDRDSTLSKLALIALTRSQSDQLVTPKVSSPIKSSQSLLTLPSFARRLCKVHNSWDAESFPCNENGWAISNLDGTRLHQMESAQTIIPTRREKRHFQRFRKSRLPQEFTHNTNDEHGCRLC